MPLRIMAVDDEPEVLKLLKMFLEPLGVEVLTMVDCREAVERLNRERFDAIFVDAQMPHLDGFGLTRRIRESPLNSGAPIVMVTEYDDVETMREGFNAGVTFFLGKPIDPGLNGVARASDGAVLTSFISTCKRLDIDPFAYLRDIFERISTHPQTRLAELLPDQWREARRAAALS